jgi:hypothetical protein
MIEVPSVMASLLRAALVVGVCLGSTEARADDDRPPTSHLLGAGLAMALPTYAIGVAVHEGSHALAGAMMGADVTTLRLWPSVVRGKFYFGYVEVRGLRCDRQRAAFLLAPKITDAILLGGFAAAWFGGALPDDPYGRLALTVLATGIWVDFSRDVIAWWDHNDLMKVYRMAGATTTAERLPYRLLHAGLATAGAVAIARSYQRIFERAPPGSVSERLLPIWSGRF